MGGVRLGTLGPGKALEEGTLEEDALNRQVVPGIKRFDREERPHRYWAGSIRSSAYTP